MSTTSGLEVMAKHRNSLKAMETLLADVFEEQVSPNLELRDREAAALNFYKGVQDYTLITSDVLVTFNSGDSQESQEKLMSAVKGADFIYADTSLGEGHLGLFGVFEGVTFYIWHHGMRVAGLAEGETHPLIAEHGLTEGTTESRQHVEDEDEDN